MICNFYFQVLFWLLQGLFAGFNILALWHHFPIHQSLSDCHHFSLHLLLLKSVLQSVRLKKRRKNTVSHSLQLNMMFWYFKVKAALLKSSIWNVAWTQKNPFYFPYQWYSISLCISLFKLDMQNHVWAEQLLVLCGYSLNPFITWTCTTCTFASCPLCLFILTVSQRLHPAASCTRWSQPPASPWCSASFRTLVSFAECRRGS